ncbi:MAG TPA: hypothetical protein VEG34_15630 [Thermoanaerobaculia bacterium]|nr:hypothetical protein [Thermoanaerobaculia bacterium]
MKILFVLLAAALLTSGGAPPPDVTSFALFMRWQSLDSDHAGRGITLDERADLVATHRLLAETPDGRRLVLTREASPTTGSLDFVLVDDATGWKARLTEVSGLLLRNTVEMGDAPLIAGKWLAKEYPRRLTFKAPGLAPSVVATDTRDETALQQVVFKVSAESRAGFAKAAPEGLRHAIGFLSSLLSSNIAEVELFRPLLTVLAEVYGADQVQGRLPFTGTRWSTVAAGSQRGTALVKPDEIAFAQGFRSLQHGDPLAGVHAVDLARKHLGGSRDR